MVWCGGCDGVVCDGVVWCVDVMVWCVMVWCGGCDGVVCGCDGVWM